MITPTTLKTAASTPSISRRSFLKKTTQAMIFASCATGPFVHAKGKPTIRVLGTHVTLREAIRKKAVQDLGINIIFEPGGSARVLQKASAHPDTFDVYEQWSNSINILWRANAIQPIDIQRIQRWNDVNALTKNGRLKANTNIGLGDAPYKLLYVQPDQTLSANPTKQLSFLPYVHNVDSFGYNTQFIPKGIAYQTESWGWLLDPRWKGKVALVNAPTIGIFDAALAAQAQGLMTFNNLGNMTKQEVDQLFKILIEKKQDGHFSGFWNSVPESVDYFASGRAHIASMFSPAVSTLNGKGFPVVYAAPKEGYRAWHGVMCLSVNTKNREQDAAYEYMNWWLSGWPGAFVARQGYYISIPERAKPHLTSAEWDYWYEGKPATTDLYDQNGNIAIKKGSTRNGGSYWQRFSNVAVWNTVMDTYEYSLPRWHELLLT